MRHTIVENKLALDKERFFREKLHFTDDELIQKAMRISDIKEYKRGRLFIEEDEPNYYIGFLMNDGLLRGFYRSDDGTEVCECFVHHVGQAIIDKFPISKKSSLSIDAIDDSIVLRMPVQEAELLLKNYPECMQLALTQLAQLRNDQIAIKNLIATYRGEERIQQFELKFPELASRLSASVLSSFLGISERTLYRAKAKTGQQK